MATQKNIQLYIYVDGINDIPFYGTSCNKNNENENIPNCEQVEIGAFKYEAKRMGGLPTISFTLYHPESLEGLWNENIYGLFNGRKFFLKQTPSEKISNDNLMYEYSVELVDENTIIDVQNMKEMLSEAHKMYDGARAETKELREEFSNYKEENMAYVAEFKKRFAKIESRLEKTELAVYQGYRCPFPPKVADCPVLKEYEKGSCEECNVVSSNKGA